MHAPFQAKSRKSGKAAACLQHLIGSYVSCAEAGSMMHRSSAVRKAVKGEQVLHQQRHAFSFRSLMNFSPSKSVSLPDFFTPGRSLTASLMASRPLEPVPRCARAAAQRLRACTSTVPVRVPFELRPARRSRSMRILSCNMQLSFALICWASLCWRQRHGPSTMPRSGWTMTIPRSDAGPTYMHEHCTQYEFVLEEARQRRQSWWTARQLLKT